MAKLVLTLLADDKAKATVQALNKEVLALSKTLSSIKVNKDLTAQINALTEHYTALANAQLKIAANAKKQAAGIETTRKGYANLITTLKTLKSQYADGVFGKLPQDAERAFKKIQEISTAFEQNGKLTKAQAKAYAQLSQQLKKYTADLATVKAKNDKIVAANPFTVTQAQQIPRLIKQYSTLLSTIKNTEKYYPKGTFDTFKIDLTQGQADLQALNQEFLTTGKLSQDSQVKLNNLANAYNQLNASVAQTTSTMKSSKGSLTDIVMGFAKFQLSAMLVMKPLRLVQDALSSINETLVKTEDAVIALQRVLPTGSATDSEISSRLYKVAQDYGQTFENVSQIATNFARTGMSWADTIKATEAAVLALNVAELDAEEATIGLNAILSQFHLTASDLESVIDKLNKTADNFPVTTEKILAALQRTGSAADSAKLSLEQTIALITALSKATERSGENIGTALNSLIQYSSKASALDTFAGLSEQSAEVVERFRQGGANILDVWRQVSKEIQNLKADQADLLDQYFATEDGEALKDALDGELQDIYTELGGVYDTANTFRKNYFIALLGNMDTVEQAMGTLGDAAGYSQKENEKYLKTYTAKLNSLKAQWEDLANSAQGILGLKKFFVDIGSALLTATKWTGGLTTALLAAGTAVTALFGAKIVEKVKAFNSKLSSGAFAIQKNFGDLVSAQLNASFANDQLTLAQERLNAARQKGIEVIEAEVAVTKAETAVTEANTAAKKAQAAAIGSVLTYAMLAITVISSVVGAIRQWNEEQKRLEEERRNVAQSSISEVNDTISALNDYIDKLDELKLKQAEGKDVTAELAKVQDELKKKYEGVAEAIGKSNNKLQDNIDLTSEAARQAAIEDALRWRLTNDKAIKEATKDVETSVKVGSVRHFDDESKIDLFHDIQSALNEAGFGEFFDARITHGQHKNAYASGKFSFEGQKDEIIKQIEAINAYVNEKGLGMGVTQEELDLLKKMLSEAYNSVNTEAYKADKEIYEYNQKIEKLLNGGSLAEFLGIQEDITTETGEWHNNIEKVTKKYDDLIDKLEELRDKDKEILDLEKAKRELENAQNEATVRRYNEETGQWEWQTDEKRIAEARENLEEQAYEAIIDLLNKEDPPTNEQLVDLLDGLEEYLGTGFVDKIKQAFKDETNVDLDQPVKSYDSGGIASGMGFMPKATDKPETVNNPDLTAKILSPVSNDQFHRYVRDMGLLFETSRRYAQAPVVERVGGNTDNSVNNSGQIIFGGGLTVGADKRGASLDEILALGGIVPNV